MFFGSIIPFLLGILIVIIRTYKNKFKVKLYKNKIKIEDLKILGGKNNFSKKYEKIIGYNNLDGQLIIYYKLNEEDINIFKLRNLNKEQINQILDIFDENKINEISIDTFKKTINYKLITKVIPTIIFLSLIFVLFIWVIIYTIFNVF